MKPLYQINNKIMRSMDAAMPISLLLLLILCAVGFIAMIADWMSK